MELDEVISLAKVLQLLSTFLNNVDHFNFHEFDPFQPSVAFYIETSHSICRAK